MYRSVQHMHSQRPDRMHKSCRARCIMSKFNITLPSCEQCGGRLELAQPEGVTSLHLIWLTLCPPSVGACVTLSAAILTLE